MDSSDDKSAQSLFGIGSSWMRKKRYEEEDFTFSPPSDDAGFFQYKFGASKPVAKPSESMFDRINKELNLSVEVPKREVTPDRFTASANSLFGVGTTKLDDYNHSTCLQASDGHRIIIPPVILEKRESLGPEGISEELSLEVLKNRPEFSRVAFEDAETLVRKAKPGRPTRKISMNLNYTVDRDALIANFQQLSTNNSELSPSPVSDDNPEPTSENSPSSQSINNPFIDTLALPSGIKERRRKTSAPPSLNPMDPSSNSIFSGGFFSSIYPKFGQTRASSETLQVAPSNVGSLEVATPALTSQSVPTSPRRDVSLDENTKKMQDMTRQTAALEPKMGKKKSKPSALKEMNMWVPQSF